MQFPGPGVPEVDPDQYPDWNEFPEDDDEDDE